LFNGKYGVQTDPNALLYMRARNYNPYLCRFIGADPSGFSGGLNFYAYANGNPVSYVDPFGLGAVSDAMAAASWFNAPTPEETQVQDFLASFVNFVTLGTANLVSSLTTGTDLTGNYLNIDDAFEQTLETATFAASLPLAVITDGGSIEAEGALEAGLGESAVESPGITALGSRTDVANFAAQNPGVNTFPWESIAPENWDRENALWLNTAIQRGDTLYYVTDPAVHEATLNSLGITPPPQSAYLNLEIPMVQQYEGVNIVHAYAQ